MRRHLAPALIGTVSLALLAGALAFQFIGGLEPCPLCHWQRYAHLVALIAAAIALVGFMGTLWTVLAAAGLLASGAIGTFHVGVERGWWQGLTHCSARPADGGVDDLLAQIESMPLVRCDAVPWELLGISMAGFNALISIGAALAAGAVLWRTGCREEVS